MKKAILPAVLGLLSPFIFILGAEPFEEQGGTSFLEILAGSLVLVLYLAACQFWVARGGNRGLKASWPTMLAMAVPVVGWVAFMAVVERVGTVLTQGIPMLAAGCSGILLGAALAARRAFGSKSSVGS